jgi:LacI family fructose operon transcriptional repressor
VPIVLVDRSLPGHNTDLVTTNNELGAEEIVEHLIKLGHRRIGFIGIKGLSTIEERWRGYRMTMKEYGLEIDDAWVHVDEQVNFDSGGEATLKLLALPPDRRPTAMFGGNDYIADKIGRVARASGLRVPEDLSVAGFDNDPGDANRPNWVNWLTTYAQPLYRIGRQAARLLMNRLENPSKQTITAILEGELVIRNSTAPPPGPGQEIKCVPRLDSEQNES